MHVRRADVVGLAVQPQRLVAGGFRLRHIIENADEQDRDAGDDGGVPAGHKGGKHGVRLEEDVLVTKDGYEVLTRWPVKELMECWLPYN